MLKDAQTRSPQADRVSQIPLIVLPKGGGALRGIGDKIGTAPALDTGTMTLPIGVPADRSGAGPILTEANALMDARDQLKAAIKGLP